MTSRTPATLAGTAVMTTVGLAMILARTRLDRMPSRSSLGRLAAAFDPFGNIDTNLDVIGVGHSVKDPNYPYYTVLRWQTDGKETMNVELNWHQANPYIVFQVPKEVASK